MRVGLVARRQLVGGIVGLVQTDEEFFHVAIHAALAHLIRVGLDEGVMSAFGLYRQLEGAKRAGIRSRAGGGGVLGQADARKKLIRRRENVGGREMRAIEMAHYGV